MAAFDSTGLRWRAWDQRVNFQRNGFVAGLLYNTHVTAMAEPKGYSKAKVEAVLKDKGATLWIQHDIVADAKLKKSPAYYD